MLALLLVYCNRDRGVMETCKRAATVMSGNTEVVRRWVKSALQGESAAEDDNDDFMRSHHPGVRWLLDEEPELQVEVKQWVREHGCVKGVPNLTARRFADYINSDIIQRISTGRKAPIHEDTARRWLHLLGFSKVQHQKGTFYDGHERADVVEARRIFLDQTNELDRRATVLEKTSTRRFHKPQIRVYHDECIFQSNADETYFWSDGTMQTLKPKSMGSSIMVSDFIDEQIGYLANTHQEAREYLEIGVNKEGFWNNDRFMKQVRKLSPFLSPFTQNIKECLYLITAQITPKCQRTYALNVNVMNVNPGGNQPKLRNTTWEGKEQEMTLPDGRPKGMRLVLLERGINTTGMKAADMRDAWSMS